ncbi:MAG: MBL fold metallo-hydrolase [Bacteroidota bacterium]
MTIRFWGVRGSIPAPGPDTVRYGGNTSCVSVETEEAVLILDAGTGIRALGDYLQGVEKDIYLLLSHVHADHVIGFPFFWPLWEPERPLYLFPHRAAGEYETPLIMLDGIHFPMKAEHIPSRPILIEEQPEPYLRERGFVLDRIACNHPGGAFGFRITHNGKRFVHIPDNELNPPGARTTEFAAFVDFCAGAVVLSHDAQFIAEDLPMKHGWGHSQVRSACTLARQAGAGTLVLFHHDPDRKDDDLDWIEREAQALAGEVKVVAGREGLTFEL